MIRTSTLLWIGLALLFAVSTFHVKHRVQILDAEIETLQRQVRDDRGAIALLHAEWAYLNRPDRLAEMAGRHLRLQPMLPNQIAHLETLPSTLPVPVVRGPVPTPKGATVAAPAGARGAAR